MGQRLGRNARPHKPTRADAFSALPALRLLACPRRYPGRTVADDHYPDRCWPRGVPQRGEFHLHMDSLSVAAILRVLQSAVAEVISNSAE